MRVKETIKVDRELDKEVLCNKCGNSMLSKRDGSELGSFFYCDVRHLNDRTSLEDETSYEWDMCDGCLSWLFEQFTIPVKKEKV